MSNILDKLYLIKIDQNGSKSEVPASETNFLVGISGTANFGLNSEIIDSQNFGVATSSVILGGYSHQTSGNWNVINGGIFNTVRSQGSVVGGGIFNNISGDNSLYSVIAGGCSNKITCARASILGGYGNILGNQDLLHSNQSLIGGGCENILRGSSWSAILGGYRNVIQSGVSDGGGFLVTPAGTSNFIGTAQNSLIQNYTATSTVLNGKRNHILGERTCFNSIINGLNNFSSGQFSTLLNGRFNNISGSHVVILNGTGNKVFSNNASILAGSSATIPLNHNGAVLLTDSQDRIHNSSGPHTLTLDFISGTYIKNQTILQNSYIPSSSTSPGISGQIATDSNYIYSHNGIKWRRTALAEW